MLRHILGSRRQGYSTVSKTSRRHVGFLNRQPYYDVIIWSHDFLYTPSCKHSYCSSPEKIFIVIDNLSPKIYTINPFSPCFKMTSKMYYGKRGRGSLSCFHKTWPIWLALLPPQFYHPRSKEHCWVSQNLLALRVNGTTFSSFSQHGHPD